MVLGLVCFFGGSTTGLSIFFPSFPGLPGCECVLDIRESGVVGEIGVFLLTMQIWDGGFMTWGRNPFLSHVREPQPPPPTTLPTVTYLSCPLFYSFYFVLYMYGLRRRDLLKWGAVGEGAVCIYCDHTLYFVSVDIAGGNLLQQTYYILTTTEWFSPLCLFPV